MQLRAAWCAFRTPQSASATSTHSSKKTASPLPKYPPCLSYPPSSLTLPSTYPPYHLNCAKSSPRSDSHRSREILPKLWLSCCPKALKDQLAPVCPVFPRAFQTSRRSSPRFLAGRSSTSLTSRTASTALCLKMPKKQQQQNQQKDKNQHDLELNQLIRHSPLPPAHHPQLRSRSPSPSSPNGSALELPNVPSYPRLPPIVSPPSKQLNSLSRQLSGLSNPAFFIEDNSDIPAIRRAGEFAAVEIMKFIVETWTWANWQLTHNVWCQDKLKWKNSWCKQIIIYKDIF